MPDNKVSTNATEQTEISMNPNLLLLDVVAGIEASYRLNLRNRLLSTDPKNVESAILEIEALIQSENRLNNQAEA